VLLVCSDVAGSGPLREVTGCTEPFACALVLAPQRGDATMARLELQLNATQDDTPLRQPLAGWRTGNPSAAGLPLLSLLAGAGGQCQLRAGPTRGLRIDMEKVI
ncbi:MAG: beta-ketoacyl synthase chain length factor, partial [Rhodanobacter sp.]